jgi:hypothetical protein
MFAAVSTHTSFKPREHLELARSCHRCKACKRCPALNEDIESTAAIALGPITQQTGTTEVPRSDSENEENKDGHQIDPSVDETSNAPSG